MSEWYLNQNREPIEGAGTPFESCHSQRTTELRRASEQRSTLCVLLTELLERGGVAAAGPVKKQRARIKPINQKLPR